MNFWWYLKLWAILFILLGFVFAQLVTKEEAARACTSEGVLWFWRSIIFSVNFTLLVCLFRTM